MYIHIWKPLIGMTVAGMALLVLAPLLILISVCLFCITRKSPFFLQTRVGRHEKLFKIIKFKTMTNDRDLSGTLLSDAERGFPFGDFLRRSSLDELPQLINILKGDMAFVGPRPWIPEQLMAFPKRYCTKRCSVRPGITGLAQIHGRNDIPFCRRLCYDSIYVGRVSCKMDAIILCRTVQKILAREGIQQCQNAFQNKLGQPLVQKDLSLRPPSHP